MKIRNLIEKGANAKSPINPNNAGIIKFRIFIYLLKQ